MKGEAATRRRDRRTVATAAALAALAAALARSRLLGAAAAVLASCLVSPALTARAAAVWLALGRALERVNRWILLGTAFLLLLTPLALVRRLAGGGCASFRLRRGQRTMWIVRDHRFGPDDLERPW